MYKKLLLNQLELIRLRNTHPAFLGQLKVNNSLDSKVSLEWHNKEAFAKLDADLDTLAFEVSCSDLNAETFFFAN